MVLGVKDPSPAEFCRSEKISPPLDARPGSALPVDPGPREGGDTRLLLIPPEPSLPPPAPLPVPIRALAAAVVMEAKSEAEEAVLEDVGCGPLLPPPRPAEAELWEEGPPTDRLNKGDARTSYGMGAMYQWVMYQGGCL